MQSVGEFASLQSTLRITKTYVSRKFIRLNKDVTGIYKDALFKLYLQNKTLNQLTTVFLEIRQMELAHYDVRY